MERKSSEEKERVEKYIKIDSQYLNKDFFVTDFRYIIGQSRAIRDISPVKARLISIEKYKELCKENNIKPKDIYFSHNVFIRLNKKGELDIKKHISIFDHTGHTASFSLFIYDDIELANEQYNLLISSNIEELNIERIEVLNRIDYQINFFEKKKV